MPPGPELKLYVDGGARGNPGPAGAGIFLLDARSQQPLHEAGYYLGRTTNNHAEYQALIRGLKLAATAKPGHLAVFSDSELLVRQITGQYRVKAPALRPLHQQARDLLGELPAWTIEHVSRSQNERADALANDAMDAGHHVEVVTELPGPEKNDEPITGTGPGSADTAQGPAASIPTWRVELIGTGTCRAGCHPGASYRMGPTTPTGLCVHAAAAALHDGPLQWPQDQHTGEVPCSACKLRLRLTRETG